MPVNVIIEKIDPLDKVQQWRQKSNSFVQFMGQVTTLISESESLNDLFIQDFANTSGLSFAVAAGKIRNRANITDVPATILVLPDSQTSYVYIDTTDSTIKSSITEPTENAIPLYQVITDLTGITSILDKRTWATINTDITLIEAFPLVEVFNLQAETTIIQLAASKTIDATVYVDGYRKIVSLDYIIISETEIQFLSPLSIGTQVLVAGTVPEDEVKSFTSVDIKVATVPNQTIFPVTSVGILTKNVSVWVDGIRQHSFTIDFGTNTIVLDFGVPVGTEVLIAKIELRGGLFSVYDGNNGDILYKVGSAVDVWDFAPPQFDAIAIIDGVIDPIRFDVADAADKDEWFWAYLSDRLITPEVLDDIDEERKFNNWTERTFGKIEDFYMTGFNGRSVLNDYYFYEKSPTEIKCSRYGKVALNPQFEEGEFNGFGKYYIRNAPFMIADSVMIRDPAVRYSAPKMILVGEYGGTRLAVLEKGTTFANGNWVSVPTPFGSGWEIIGLGAFNYTSAISDGDEVIFVSGYNKTLNQSSVYKRAASQFPSGGSGWTLVQINNNFAQINKITKFASSNTYYGSPIMWGVDNDLWGFNTFTGIASNIPEEKNFVGASVNAHCVLSFCSYNNVNIADGNGVARYHNFMSNDDGVYYAFEQRLGASAANPFALTWTHIYDLKNSGGTINEFNIGQVHHIAAMFEPSGTNNFIVIFFGTAGVKAFRKSGAGAMTFTAADEVKYSLPIQQAIDSSLIYFSNLNSFDENCNRTLLQDKNGDYLMFYYGASGAVDPDAAGRFPILRKAFTSVESPAPKISTKAIVRGKGITMVLADYPVNAVWVKGHGIDYVKPISSKINETKGIWFINNTFVIITRETFAMSTDGVNWTETVFSNQLRNETYPVQLAYGNGKWVIANGNKTRYSTDGITWVNLDENIPENVLRNVIFDGTQFVGINYISEFVPTPKEIVTSPDGITWTAVGLTTYTDIAYNAYYGGYIAIDGYEVHFSPDLINWSLKKSTDLLDGKISGEGKHIFIHGTLAYNGRHHNVVIKNLNAPFNESVDYYSMPLNIHDEPSPVFEDNGNFLVGIKTINNITGRLPVYYEAKL